MAITDSQESKLNKSMRAAQDVSLGTIIQGLQGGAHTVTSAEANASAVSIVAPLTPTVALVQIYRSGSAVTSDAYVVKGTNALTISKGSTYAVTTNDIINYLVA